MNIQTQIFSINNDSDFTKLALEVFQIQYDDNVVYREFCELLNTQVRDVNALQQIPFLPISFFKSHKVITGNREIEEIFTSSGTTGSFTSNHHVTDISLYGESFRKGFSKFYGNVEDYTILALLPSYLDRAGSSLIFMVDGLINDSKSDKSGYYLHDLDALVAQIKKIDGSKKAILLGVTYALLDLIEKEKLSLKNTIVMETGGMKGKRREMVRTELHEILKEGFGVTEIHSEYGMTELLSQAYSIGKGIFNCPPWMKVLIRDTEDPFGCVPNGKTGGINVIDLANLNSCAFIATEDLGRSQTDGGFEVLGRFDNSEIRGCNLMVI